MLLLRRVQGDSMLPSLAAGKIVVATRMFRKLRPGDVVIVQHDGVEKIKRVITLKLDKIYILGDNSAQSTDSRHFGWLHKSAVQGKMLWPRR
jgi:nickel-type superoxide dismutase maturation protease